MILALQTADHTTHLQLYKPTAPQPSAELSWDSGRQLADQLLAKLTQFLADHHVVLTDLTGIIIFSGPGSFTSLRIGHSVANALADSLGVPVVGATGDDWRTTALAALATAKPGHPALPHYGSEANITRPKA